MVKPLTPRLNRTVRFRDHEEELVIHAAAAKHRRFAEFVREAALREARRVLSNPEADL